MRRLRQEGDELEAVNGEPVDGFQAVPSLKISGYWLLVVNPERAKTSCLAKTT